MPELPNRDQIEARVAALMARVNEHQRSVLLTHMGWPPDARRIPAKLIAEFEKQVEDATYGVMALMFLQSAEQLQGQLGYRIPESELTPVGHAWAQNQASFVAKQTIGTKFGKVTDVVTDLYGGGGAAGHPWAKGEGVGILNVEPTWTQDEFEQSIVDVFNDASAKAIASTEATSAATAGEQAVADNFQKKTGKVLVCFWRHRTIRVPGRHPCVKICQPLENQPSEKWPEIHPDLPMVWNGPPAHVHCDCELEWVELSREEAHAYGILGD